MCPFSSYSIIIEGERGNRQRIYSQEQLLQEAVSRLGGQGGSQRAVVPPWSPITLLPHRSSTSDLSRDAASRQAPAFVPTGVRNPGASTQGTWCEVRRDWGWLWIGWLGLGLLWTPTTSQELSPCCRLLQ